MEADLAFRGVDLLDFYRGRMSARRLAVLVDHLPPEAMSVRLALHGPDEQPQQPQASPRSLEGIPVVSLREARQFINSSGDEFASRFADSQAS